MNKEERELQVNCDRFREFCKQMISERRTELEDPKYEHKGDLLTILI